MQKKSAAVLIQVIAGVVISLLPAPLMAEKRSKTALGIDVDFYTGPISHKVWQRLKEANQKFVIAQAWGGRSRNEFAASQLAGGRSMGMKTAAYILLSYDNKVCPTFERPVRDTRGTCTGDLISQDEPGGRWQVQQGLAALGSEREKVAFIAIDVEWFASPAPPSESIEQARHRQYILDAIDEVKRQHKKPVIYTRNGKGHWLDITGCEMTSPEAACTTLYHVINDPVTPIALWDVQEGTPELGRYMSIKINAQLGRLKAIGKIVRKTLDEMTAAVLSGMTTGGELKSTVVNVKVTTVIVCVLCFQATREVARSQANQAPAVVGVALDIRGVVKGGTKIERIKEGFNGLDDPIGLMDGTLVFSEPEWRS